MDANFEKRRLGVNLASILPWSAYSLRIAERVTRQAGFAFWQVLPFWSVSGSSLMYAQVPTKYVESAWNATTLWRHLSKKPGSEGLPTKWQDVLFFPSPMSCLRRYDSVVYSSNIVEISHRLRRGAFVEFHSGLKVPAKEMSVHGFSKISKKWVVLDTYHLRHVGGGSFRPYKEWREDLITLAPLTALVHVQASGYLEWKRFEHGLATEMGDIINYLLAKGFTGNFVVEYRPGTLWGNDEILFPRVLAQTLKEVRDSLFKIVLGE